MANIFKFGTPIALRQLAADPSSPVNGELYYNTVSNVIRQYVNSTWQDVSAGSIALTGQTLTEGGIIVGNASNQSAAVDTDLVGDIQASSAGGLEIKAGVIVNADINASAAIAYSKLSLADSIVNADINSAAAIAYSKLALSNSIVNADIAAGAAIALDKLAALTATRVLASDGSGVISVASFAPADVILKNGTVAFTADQSIGGFKITNLGAPVAGTDAATKNYVDSVAEGLKPKTAARVATTANITIASDLNVGDVIDGITLVNGDRVLVKDQSTASENGIYVAGATPARSTDFDSLSPIDEINGALVAVQEGTLNSGKVFVQSGTVTTIGTDPISFVFFNSSATLVGGDGITISGSNVSVDHDGEGLQFVAAQLALELDGTTLSKSSTGLKVASGGITNTEVNAAAAIAYSKLSLAGSIVNADINSAAAIAYSKLALTNSVVNADIAAAAAIALTKLAAVTANRALVSDVSGFIVASSVTDVELGHLAGVTSAIQTQLNGKASQALDNLASVAINTSLISDTNNTDDLGSDAIEWKDAWVHRIAHDDATNPDLVIETTGNNGDVIIKAHGSGNHDIQASKLRLSEGASSINFMEQEYFDAVNLADAQTDSVISDFVFAHASFEGFELEYKIKEAVTNRVRIGKLSIVTNGTDVSVSDNFNESADVGISFSAVVAGADINVRFSSTGTGNARTLRGLVKRIRA